MVINWQGPVEKRKNRGNSKSEKKHHVTGCGAWNSTIGKRKSKKQKFGKILRGKKS